MQATATAAAKSMGSPGKKQQRNPASGLEASRQAAAEAAALQAAAALLEQEERAAEVSHQAKQRSASKKARQKQRQQVQLGGCTRHICFDEASLQARDFPASQLMICTASYKIQTIVSAVQGCGMTSGRAD